MIYCDAHSDALTAPDPVTTKEALTAANCFLQTFAVFLSSPQAAFLRANALIDRFDRMCVQKGFRKVKSASECGEGVNALLSLENAVAFGGDCDAVPHFAKRGVRMAGLCWNFPNGVCAPSVCGVGNGVRERRLGLSGYGFRLCERLFSEGILPDVSHASERTVKDVALFRKPFVATHSGSDRVFSHPRNLSDGAIKKIADSGGGVGLYFCDKFLSDDLSAEGQRRALLAHARAIVNAGGEDCLFLGSDFDGTSPNAFLPNPRSVPKLLRLFERHFGGRVAEKIASRNFLRILG